MGASIRGIAELKPDVVIFGIHMPGGNGLQVFRRLKTSRFGYRTHELPLPRIQGDSDGTGGADYFFDKAARFDEIREALEKAL